MPEIIPQPGGDETTLPPPGDARREVLAARQDALDEAGETRAAALEQETIAPQRMRVDREIAQHVNELDVSSADPTLAYCWVYTGRNGFFIKSKSVQGWEVVQGDRPEALELKGMGADTTRRLGDVILMSIRLDRYIKIRRQEEDARRLREDAITADLQEMGDKAGITVHTTARPETLQRLEAQHRASALADRQVDHLIRDGRMPGVRAR